MPQRPEIFCINEKYNMVAWRTVNIVSIGLRRCWCFPWWWSSWIVAGVLMVWDLRPRSTLARGEPAGTAWPAGPGVNHCQAEWDCRVSCLTSISQTEESYKVILVSPVSPMGRLDHQCLLPSLSLPGGEEFTHFKIYLGPVKIFMIGQQNNITGLLINHTL